jgi:hypothetical protein
MRYININFPAFILFGNRFHFDLNYKEVFQ